jgi:hypothetical protein
MSYIGNQPQYTSFLSDTFSGNGSTTVYTMAVAPTNTAAVIVAIFGILQDPTTYGVVGRILTFSQAPPTGTGNISVRYLALPASNITTTAYRSVTEFTATAGQTTFTPASYTPGFISVFRSGVRLGATNFTATNGVTVVLTNAAAAGDLITIESFFVSAVLNAIPNVAGAITPTLLDSTSQSGSGAIQIPVGTTAQRPTSPTNGMVRKNTTTGYVEYWDPATSSWLAIGAFAASGGIVSTSGLFTLHTFTSSGVFTVSAGSASGRILVVAGGGAGGGGGGQNGGGGGGGGGVIIHPSFTLTPGTYTVTVGNGGTPGAALGGPGQNSVFGPLTAIGGGGGGANGGTNPGAGGSGGGRGRDQANNFGAANQTSQSGDSGLYGFGNRGGGGVGGGCQSGGGGGGAGGVGFDGGADCGATPQNVTISDGGVGIQWSVNGEFYGGGGGGAYESSNVAFMSAGGNGGGGGGGGQLGSVARNGIAGTANRGGGGGGGQIGASAGAGGSGIVIVAYITT